MRRRSCALAHNGAPRHRTGAVMKFAEYVLVRLMRVEGSIPRTVARRLSDPPLSSPDKSAQPLDLLPSPRGACGRRPRNHKRHERGGLTVITGIAAQPLPQYGCRQQRTEGRHQRVQMALAVPVPDRRGIASASRGL